MNDESPPRLSPAPALAGARAYHVPRHPGPVRWRLDAGECLTPPAARFGLAVRPDDEDAVLSRYPDHARLESLLAHKLGIAREQVLVTAGADDALDRVCRAFLAPSRRLLFPTPSFEMIPRYARWTGAEVVEFPWPDGPWPVDAALDLLAHTPCDVIAVVSPNNPTGATLDAEGLQRLRDATPGALLLLDHAYVEFADHDLTALALSLPDVVVTRTFSKAWGLAGARVGYVLGPADRVATLRAAGQPYAVAGPSAALAAAALAHGEATLQVTVTTVRAQRAALADDLRAHGFDVPASEGNFVFARGPRTAWLRDALAGLGLAVRGWPGHPLLDDAVRITLPGVPVPFDHLRDGVAAALAPEAVLLDMDGVIADVSASYRAAIVHTAAHYGVTVSADDIRAAKAAGDANNDWVLTRRLLALCGVDVTLAEVTAVFERLYQGTPSQPGLKATERLIGPADTLARLAARYPVAIVTGRPFKDAFAFLQEHGLTPHVRAVVAMEDGPAKPDPAPVRRSLELLGVRHAWMVGDTPDDAVAAARAGVVPIGVPAPGEAVDAATDVLLRAGCARVLPRVDALLELLP